MYDLLVTTDVLAEGVNLQQARHIINYDLPWNPKRLVQRPGRIDRIGSPHDEVFMRCFFPDEDLDRILGLEERLQRKIKQAAAAVGVGRILPGIDPVERSITETRDLIDQIRREENACSKTPEPVHSPVRSTAADSPTRSRTTSPSTRPGTAVGIRHRVRPTRRRPRVRVLRPRRRPRQTVLPLRPPQRDLTVRLPPADEARNRPAPRSHPRHPRRPPPPTPAPTPPPHPCRRRRTTPRSTRGLPPATTSSPGRSRPTPTASPRHCRKS